MTGRLARLPVAVYSPRRPGKRSPTGIGAMSKSRRRYAPRHQKYLTPSNYERAEEEYRDLLAEWNEELAKLADRKGDQKKDQEFQKLGHRFMRNHQAILIKYSLSFDDFPQPPEIEDDKRLNPGIPWVKVNADPIPAVDQSATSIRTESPSVISVETKNPDQSKLPTMASAPDLARLLNQPLGLVKAFLARFRQQHHGCYEEVPNPRRNKPRILYYTAEVCPALAEHIARKSQ
jgi:hypothetical protein